MRLVIIVETGKFPWEISTRRLLKALVRRHGLRCVDVYEQRRRRAGRRKTTAAADGVSTGAADD